jgi:hypothetical protein
VNQQQQQQQQYRKAAGHWGDETRRLLAAYLAGRWGGPFRPVTTIYGAARTAAHFANAYLDARQDAPSVTRSNDHD